MAEPAFVKAMDQTQEYLYLQKQLSEALRQGMFSLTQARYSMGALGQQQYDAEMQATATVTVVEDDSSDSMYSTFELQSSSSAQRDHTTPSTTTTATAAVAVAAAGPAGLRQRTVGSRRAPSGTTGAEEDETSSAASASDKGPSGEEDSSSRDPSAAEGGSSSKARAPLSWFGVLVPPTLREAQASFRQALELAVQLANRAQGIRQGLEDLEIERADAA